MEFLLVLQTLSTFSESRIHVFMVRQLKALQLKQKLGEAQSASISKILEIISTLSTTY